MIIGERLLACSLLGTGTMVVVFKKLGTVLWERDRLGMEVRTLVSPAGVDPPQGFVYLS